MPRALLILLIVSTLARLALAGVLDLGQDEAYALAVSRSFQWSFFDHPPLAFWTAGLMQAVFGRQLPPLLLRLPFVLMFSGSTWALFALTRRFYGSRAGLWAAGLLTTAPFFFASAGSWVVPDGPLLLTLLLAAIFLARALAEQSDDGHWADWLWTGLFLGLALLSKYQALLVLFGGLLVLLLPANRKWLLRPQPYVALVLAFLLFTPVVWWNAANGWVSFAFQLGRGDGTGGLDLRRFADLLSGEALYLLPWLLIALLLAAGASLRAGAGRFFVALALPTLVVFNLLPLAGASGLPHWSMAGWLFLFPPLGALAAGAEGQGRRWPALLGGVSALALIAIAVGAVLLVSNWRIFPGNRALNHFLIEATSWTGVRDGMAAKGLLDRPGTFLAAVSWLDGAHLAEALRPAEPPVVLGGDPRGFAFVQNANAHLGEDAIFVASAEALGGVRLFAAAHFDSVEQIGTFETQKGGLPAYRQTVILAHHFSTPVAVPYGLK
ncbi:MAG: glycosyltransferase family 39 protein [Devosia sp.]|nr:glycosyltransferase family 39 protein [Devosia sp.]